MFNLTASFQNDLNMPMYVLVQNIITDSAASSLELNIALIYLVSISYHCIGIGQSNRNSWSQYLQK